jgi:non-heme chloroperoxidase
MSTPNPPVVFIHGLWLHATSWQPWAELFRERGHEVLMPGWPGEASTVEETRRDARQQAGRGIDEVTEHHARVVAARPVKPIVIGHSFGGLFAQKLLGRGLASAAVAIDPAPQRGVLRVPPRQLAAALPVLRNPLNYWRAVSLTPAQFRFAFGNALTADESDALHAAFSIPGPGRPLFEAAFANLNPRTAARVDTGRADRGPLLVIGGGKDNTVPESVSRAAHHLYAHAGTVNDYRVFPDRGHSLVIDHGLWEVAETVLAWLAEHRLSSPKEDASSERTAAE